MRFFICLIGLSSLVTSALAEPTITLREKIGQMLVVGFEGKQISSESPIVQNIQKDNIGGVILFERSKNNSDKNIESPEQVKALTRDLQRINYESNVTHHRPQLPLIISIDYEGGKVERLKESDGFPATLSAANAGKMPAKKVNIVAKTMALTLKKAGFNLNLAPVVDLNINPENPIIAAKDRSFSDDPVKVIKYSRIYAHQLLKQKIQCAYKHFPGHGSSSQDSHLGFVDVTHSWSPLELEPYRKLLNSDKSCGLVLSAHIVNRQLDARLPATLSYKVLTTLLREQLHFQGVVITDDMDMKAIQNHYPIDEALTLAINAGADILLFGYNLATKSPPPEQLIDIIEQKVLSGAIPEQRIDEAYQRIIQLKQNFNKEP